MKVKCSVYIAASVDGFIARSDGGIDWLHRPEYSASNMECLPYDEFISTVDAIVMGRHTFEVVLAFGDWPYEGLPVVVLSSRTLEIPPALRGKAWVDSGEPAQVVARLGVAGKRHLYIDGGVTIQRFLRANLIDEIIITRIPILLGGGVPLFGSIGAEIPLRLVFALSSPNGFVQVRYNVNPPAEQVG